MSCQGSFPCSCKRVKFSVCVQGLGFRINRGVLVKESLESGLIGLVIWDPWQYYMLKLWVYLGLELW